MLIFDRSKFVKHRIRAAKNNNSHFVLDYVIRDITERIEEFNKNFDIVVELGARKGNFHSFIEKQKFNLLINTEFSYDIFDHDKNNTFKIICDDEMLPFRQSSINLIISALNLHYINDLPGHLSQIKMILQDSGIYIASFFGGKTLYELRESLMLYEMKYLNKTSPHVIPMINTADIASLAQRAGFKNSVIDSYVLEIEYPDIITLMKDLRSMGETNCLINSNYYLPRSGINHINDIYSSTYGIENSIIASFEIITISVFK